MRKLAEGLQMSAADRYWQWAAFAQDEFLEACGYAPATITPVLPHAFQDDELQQVLLSDQLVVLPNDMLHKVDLMSMRHSLEVRTPFLDHRVVEYANGLAADQKFGVRQGKAILREACRELLPDSIFERPKQGFEIPLEGLLLGALREEIMPLTRIEVLQDLGIPQPEPASAMISRFISGHNPGLAPTVWALYVLSSWLKVQQTKMK
jgi:asparagine synthase (glutamine-hydrolysing)